MTPLLEDDVVAAIRTVLEPVANRSIVLGIGDDAALWQPSRSNRSAITTDMLVEDVHFTRASMSLEDAGWRAMMANASDLAAMGARPVLATVALGLPPGTRVDEVIELYRGLAAAARAVRLDIVGGDLSRAPVLTISVAAVGEVRASNVKTRSGGHPGGVLAVTGRLGAARAGLDLTTASGTIDADLEREALRAFRRPHARCAEGRFLGASRNVEAMIDCSDGLSTDLDRLCARNAINSSVNLPADSVIFMNYAPESLTHASFDAAEFVATVRGAGLRPDQIVIEISERLIEETSAIVERATQLRALGVRIALDNIGSGHMGLEILSQLHLDFVKLDSTLVSRAIENTEARGVLAGLIAIARETGSYLIAEGIETQNMLDFVSKAHVPLPSAFAGVRGVQGYELGKPEAGRIDTDTLEQRHDFLQARRRALTREAEQHSDKSADRSAILVHSGMP